MHKLGMNGSLTSQESNPRPVLLLLLSVRILFFMPARGRTKWCWPVGVRDRHPAMALGRTGFKQLNPFLNDPTRLLPPSLLSGHVLRCFSDVTGSASGGKRLLLNDTLSLVRRLEAQDLNAKQAEGITSAITQVLNGSLESVAQSFSTKGEMLNSEMVREAALSKFKEEIQSSQENHFTTLRNETEKLRADIDKMRSEFRYEVDKVASAQRLDLNLERGRIRDELASQSEETQNLTNKLDKGLLFQLLHLDWLCFVF
eukprot:c19083_g1_i1 orf=571-1341(-)